MSFDSLGLNPDILRAIAEQGYREPTPIQQQAIPAVLEGRDLMASAQTGTGKTAGFTLPLLQHLITHQPHAKGRRPVRALILTPTRALADFKSGDIRVLVATDIAARGLDIEELPHVVNYELPNVPEDYVHRIGRTGRAAATGEALSLVCVDEHKLLRDIEKLLKKEIPRITTPGYEPDPSIKAEPIQNGRQQRGGGGRGRGQNQGGAGRSQQPRRQDSGAAKAKPKPRTGEGKPAGDKARPPRRPRRITPAQ
ncbi:DEAD/DEAH box helicase [Salmonella enterica]|nr:DEAD/DEAH box helicase [Salmonella enterica]